MYQFNIYNTIIIFLQNQQTTKMSTILRKKLIKLNY